MGVLSTLGLESEETSLLFFKQMFFFATKSENRKKVWSFHRQLCLGDATGVLPTRTTEAGFSPPLDRWPSVVWRTWEFPARLLCLVSMGTWQCAFEVRRESFVHKNFEESSSISNFESFFDAQLLKSLTTLHPEISLLSIFTVEVPFASWEPLHLGWGFLRPLEKTSE